MSTKSATASTTQPKQTKKPRTTKKTAEPAKPAKPAPEPTPAPAPEPTPAPAPASGSEPATENTPVKTQPTYELSEAAAAQFAELSAELHTIQNMISKYRVNMKALEKSVCKELKVMDKANANALKRKKTRSPSGFVKPTPISDELAEFISVDKGSLLARTEVTKKLTEYIKTNSLQDSSNGRWINPDEKLAKLLRFEKGDGRQLTYFNLQSYLAVHFQKASTTSA